MPTCAKCGTPLQVNDEGIAPVLCDRCAGVATARARKGIYTGTMRDYPATAALVAINVGVFVAMAINGASILQPSGDALVRWGGNWGVLTLGGEYWRLLTATFVHGGIIHIVLNMWCLLSFGQLSERLFGRWQTVAIYLLTGVGGSLLSIAFRPERLSVGASGAIFGIAGALLSGVKLGNLSITSGEKRSIFSSIVFFAIFSFSMGMRANIDNMAHLGGFVTGLIVGLPLAVPSSSKGKHTLVQVGTLLATAGLLVVAGVQLVQTHGQMFKVENLLRKQEYAAAIQLLEQMTTRDPDNEEAMLRLGKAYEQIRQPDKAVAILEQAAKLNPNSAKIGTELGLAYLMSNQPVEKATATLEDAVKMDSGNADALEYLGLAYIKANQRDKAIAAFEKAIQLDPDADRAQAELQKLRAEAARDAAK
ncbi:MAG TPA: rhomboid family intramembrane serine protease [Candidatus Solibacter sp.]|jgi:rhomboid protease GluP|nr:rhomboid family intramembrane serine protease [Candidatus Solibacter sp.]